MKIAIPIWNDRISPVFDVAGQLLLVETAGGRETARQVQPLGEVAPRERIGRLLELGVGTLICGGISQPLEMELADRGIRVVARMCGNVEEVLAAFLAGSLGEERFAMPGCCGQRRRRKRNGGQGCGQGRRRGRKENA